MGEDGSFGLRRWIGQKDFRIAGETVETASFGHIACVSGLPDRRGTVLRALIELPSEKEMDLRAFLARDGCMHRTELDDEPIADTPTVDVPARLLEKVDRVFAELSTQGIDTKRSGVVRAILQMMHSGTDSRNRA